MFYYVRNYRKSNVVYTFSFGVYLFSIHERSKANSFIPVHFIKKKNYLVLKTL